jgi:Fe-S cluster assembly iron-binding protein IscA
MFSLTGAAKEHLCEVLASAPTEAAVRLSVQRKSLTPRMDMPREDDLTFQHQDRTVLVIEPQLAELLSERILDAQETEQGVKLVLRVQNPVNSTH